MPIDMEAGVDPAARSDSADPPRPREGWRVAVVLVVASLILHVGMLAALLIAPDRTPQPTPDIIPVEIVIEPPKPPTPKAAADAAPESTKPPAASPQPASTQPAQPEKLPDGEPSAALPPNPPPADAPARFDGLPASFRAVTLPATSIGGTEAANYKAIVFGLLAAAKQYPEAARARGATGAAVVAFTVDNSGNVLRASLARASGDVDLDAEALGTVRRCNPFPPPPQGAQTSFAAVIEFGSEP